MIKGTLPKSISVSVMVNSSMILTQNRIASYILLYD